MLELGELLTQFLHDLFDEEVAKRNAAEPGLAVADTKEGGGIGIIGVRQAILFPCQNRLNAAR